MMEILQINNLSTHFSHKIDNLLVSKQTTKPYIVGTLSQCKMEHFDYSKESITLVFAKAKFQPNFEKFQKLADWLLITKSLFPEALHDASSDYYNAVAQSSYAACYRLMNKQWDVFEELADCFPYIVKYLHEKAV